MPIMRRDMQAAIKFQREFDNPDAVATEDLLLRMTRNFSRDDAGVAIHGTNTENILTANAVEMSVNGVWNSLAAQTEIDISGLDFFDENGAALAAARSVPAGYECRFIFAANAADEIICCCGQPHASAAKWPIVPDLYAPFAGILVENGSASAWVIGTTDLDTASVTDTYYNLLQQPADV